MYIDTYIYIYIYVHITCSVAAAFFFAVTGSDGDGKRCKANSKQHATRDSDEDATKIRAILFIRRRYQTDKK